MKDDHEIRILHLSDLHFGDNSRFSKYIAENKCKELGQELCSCVKQELDRLDLPNDIHAVITTGDLSQSADKTEFEKVLDFFLGISGGLGLPRDNFVFTPGNHDISWQGCQLTEITGNYEKWGDDRYNAELAQKKLERYREFLASFYDPENPQPYKALNNDATLFDWPELNLSVASLNSCERESHKEEDHVGCIGTNQLHALKRLWVGQTRNGCRIIALHHNPFPSFRNVSQQWANELARDGRDKNMDRQLWQRFISDAAGLTEGGDELRQLCGLTKSTLLLSGHYHQSQEELWSWEGQPGHTILACAGSFGLEKDHMPWEQPNIINLLRIRQEPNQLVVHPLRYDPHASKANGLGRGKFVPDGNFLHGRTYNHCCEMAVGETRREQSKGDKTSQFLQEFRVRFRPLYTSWENQAIGSLRDAEHMRGARLDDMFVKLRFGRGYDIANLGRGKVIGPEEIIKLEQPLAICGQAGTGKTTWMRWIFRRLLERDDSLPLMVELRRLAQSFKGKQGADRAIDTYLKHWLGQQMGAGWEQPFVEFLKKPPRGVKPVLLVDGWDELGAMGGEVRDKLLGFLKSHKNVGIVVSSRPHSEDHPVFKKRHIQPLSDSELDKLAKAFYGKYFGPDNPEVNIHLDKLEDSLYKSSEAKTLARIPILYTMLMAVGLDDKLPEKRHKLYKKSLELMIKKIPLQKEQEGGRLGRDQWAPDDEDERWRASAALALAMMQNQTEGGQRKEIVLDRKQLQDILLPEWSRQQKRGFINWLEARTGMLVETAPDALSFIHLSFQEYLAAWKMDTDAKSDQERIESFVRLAGNPQWWETLRLWGAMTEAINPDRFGTLFKELCKDHSQGYWLAGALLADDLGDQALQSEWCKNLDLIARQKTKDIPEICANAWSVNDNEDKKTFIHNILNGLCNGRNWLDYFSFNEWAKTAGLGRIPEPISGPARRVLSSLRIMKTTRESLARGRFACCINPLFPNQRERLLFLRLWPSRRAQLGYRFQWWANLLPDINLLNKLVATASHYFIDETTDDYNLIPEYYYKLYRELYLIAPRDLTRRYFRDSFSRFYRRIARYSPSHFSNQFSSDINRNLSSYSSSYLFRNFSNDLYRDFSRDISRDFPRDVFRYVFRNFSCEFSRNFINYATLVSPLDSPRELHGNIYRYFYDDLHHDFSTHFSGYHKEEELDLLWNTLYSSLFLWGLTGPRAILANLKFKEDFFTSDLSKVYHEACNISFGRGSKQVLNKDIEAISTENQIFKSLALHIAGQSTPDDKKLLEEAATHPEKVAKDDEELLFGLQYYVRGDIILLDGTTVKLDDILSKAGITLPSFLEDTRPEIESEGFFKHFD